MSDDDLLTPVVSKPAHSVPDRTRTSYPDILNPVHDPQTSAPLSEAQTSSQQKQPQQQHACDSSKNYAYNPSQRPQAEAVHFEPSYGSKSEPDSNAFTDFLLAMSEIEGVMFPGWFLASSDEQIPPPDEDAAQEKGPHWRNQQSSLVKDSWEDFYPVLKQTLA